MCNEIRNLTPSGTSGTKRDKREKLKLGNSGLTRDNPPYRGGPVSRCPRDFEKELARLKAEVLAFCDGYTSRGIHAEGVALARLRKAAEQ